MGFTAAGFTEQWFRVGGWEKGFRVLGIRVEELSGSRVKGMVVSGSRRGGLVTLRVQGFVRFVFT